MDSVSVSVRQFNQSYIAYLISTGQNDTADNRSAHLNRMIDEILLAQEADRNGMRNSIAFERASSIGHQKALGGRFYEVSLLEQLPAPTDEEVRVAYVKSKEQVVVRHLFYRDSTSAAAAYARLSSGVGFLEEAQRCFRTEVFDSTAGYLGPIKYYMVDDAFAEVAFDLEVGEYSEPVRSRYGYHIVRVEDRIRQPLVTESEYVTRRGGIESQLKLRRMRMEGDRFVRRLMREVNVEVNAESIRALAQALKELENSVEPDAVAIAQISELTAVGPTTRPLTESTVLATYSIDGMAKTFTLGQYSTWLPGLPFDEAVNKTAASVGRALRNVVLAEKGALGNLATDGQVLEEIEENERRILALLMRMSLRNDSTNARDDDYLNELVQRANQKTLTQWYGSYWWASSNTLEDATMLAESINGGTVQIADVESGQVITSDNFSDSFLGVYAMSAPVGKAVATVTSDDSVYTIVVLDRVNRKSRAHDRVQELRRSLEPIVPELKLLTRLRSQASVTVDTTQFVQLMRLRQ